MGYSVPMGGGKARRSPRSQASSAAWRRIPPAFPSRTIPAFQTTTTCHTDRPLSSPSRLIASQPKSHCRKPPRTAPGPVRPLHSRRPHGSCCPGAWAAQPPQPRAVGMAAPAGRRASPLLANCRRAVRVPRCLAGPPRTACTSAGACLLWMLGGGPWAAAGGRWRPSMLMLLPVTNNNPGSAPTHCLPPPPNYAPGHCTGAGSPRGCRTGGSLGRRGASCGQFVAELHTSCWARAVAAAARPHPSPPCSRLWC